MDRPSLVCALLLAAACDPPNDVRPDPATGSASANDAGTNPGVNCTAYCKKLRECFPGAVTIEAWTDICNSDCASDIDDPDMVAFESAVAACSGESCSGGFHDCLLREFSDRLPKEAESKLDIRGLPGACAAQRACITAQTYNYEQDRRSTRADLYRGAATGFDALRNASSVSAISCRGVVEDKQCSGRPPPKAGTPIAVDCDAHCAKLKQCYPGPSKSRAEWGAHCKSDCERESVEGTTAAGFFATIAACRSEACGAAFGACLVRKLDEHWPKAQPADWDPRGLPESCFLLRACHEAMFVGDAQGYLQREATYQIWRDVFPRLLRTGGDPGPHCKTMAKPVAACN